MFKSNRARCQQGRGPALSDQVPPQGLLVLFTPGREVTGESPKAQACIVKKTLTRTAQWSCCMFILVFFMQGGGGASRAPRITSPLDTVPFYHVVTVTPSSTVELDVRSPATLSTYVVRAVAASSDGQTFGVGETEFTVRRPLSLTPSVPRLLRAGDTSSVGVIATYFGEASEANPAAVEVTVEPTGELLVSTEPQTVLFKASGTQEEVRFPVVARSVGESNIVFSAASTAATDSLAVDLDTLVPQAPVVLASSFPVAPAQDWKEGLDLPEAVPGVQ